MVIKNIRQTNRFYYRLLLTAFLVLACDRGIGLILRILYYNQQSGVYFQTTYSIDSTRADILVFGSSRARHHYVPKVFEDRLHYTCFNTGLDGSSILYNYALFSAITQRYIPTQVILDIRPYELRYDPSDYEKLSVLLPYNRANPEFDRLIDLRGPFEKVKRISSIYPYNSLIIQIAMGNIRNPDKNDKNSKGYDPIYDVMKSEELDTLEIETNKIDINKSIALQQIILTCQKENIDLILVNSPAYHILKDSLYTKNLQKLCTENRIKFWDMSNHPVFKNNPRYFADKSHLNDEGAKLFTNLLIDSIQQNNLSFFTP